eukprot:338761-Amphidinium_carterae.2
MKLHKKARQGHGVKSLDEKLQLKVGVLLVSVEIEVITTKTALRFNSVSQQSGFLVLVALAGFAVEVYEVVAVLIRFFRWASG